MFNIRVYGILIRANKILLVEENIRDRRILKFPGGGLEFGEGTIDCLQREFREELGMEIKDITHFYTTDFFVQSFLDATQQVISIYYLCAMEDQNVNYSLDTTMEFKWVDINDINEEMFALPIDKVVANKIMKGKERIEGRRFEGEGRKGLEGGKMKE